MEERGAAGRENERGGRETEGEKGETEVKKKRERWWITVERGWEGKGKLKDIDRQARIQTSVLKQ